MLSILSSSLCTREGWHDKHTTTLLPCSLGCTQACPTLKAAPLVPLMLPPLLLLPPLLPLALPLALPLPLLPLLLLPGVSSLHRV